MRYLLMLIVLTCIRSNAREPQPPETFILHPPQPVMVFGKTRLVYELHFRNNGNQPVNIHTVSLIGLRNQSTLVAFSSSALASRMGSMDPDPAWKRGHRRVFYAPDNLQRIPGRFAIDFIKVDTGDYAKG